MVTPDSARRKWRQTVFYAVMALVCFLLAFILLALMLSNVERLSALGLTGNLYYLVLVLFGLMVAFCLFGVLRSYAHYKGQQFQGVLELGGPIVGFLLVVVLGFWLLPKPSGFSLTVFVHGEDGPQNFVLRNSGVVWLDLGTNRRHEPIGDLGQAVFPEIPAGFRGQSVNVRLESDSYESIQPQGRYLLDDTKLYLEVHRKPGKVEGRIVDEESRPVGGASVSVAGLSAIADSAGHFEILVPGSRMSSDLSMEISARGFVPLTLTVVPNSNEVTAVLKREP